jgi:hypothetical protein
MIVALYAQRDCDSVSGVDNAGVLSRADQNVLAFGRQSGKKRPGRFVRAVLAPHHRIHGQLEMVRLAAKQS